MAKETQKVKESKKKERRKKSLQIGGTIFYIRKIM